MPLTSLRQSLKKYKRAFYLLFLACLVVVIYGILGDQGFFHLHRLKLELSGLQQKIVAVEADNARLRQEIGHLKTDPVYIERLARQDLGMLKENEVLFLFREQ
ncbi:MAG: septum formation initiator family protein [bacterium]|nr:septum formation initiator family protein [bacterium]